MEIKIGERLYVEDSGGKVQYLAIKTISASNAVRFDGIDQAFSLEELISKQDVLRKKFPREIDVAINSWDFNNPHKQLCGNK